MAAVLTVLFAGAATAQDRTPPPPEPPEVPVVPVAPVEPVASVASAVPAESAAATAASAPAEPVAPPTPLWLQNPWTGDTKLVRVPEPDMSLWNATRVEDYEAAVAQEGDPALAVLSINRLGMKVPVYNGTDEFNLDRGLGRIRGMARIDEEGHLGISGHRDGYFRILKDLVEGDRIMVRTTNEVTVYEVEGFSIVDKNDASILRQAVDDWRLTLVTCYPFYYVGNAPQRYIVHATPITVSP